MNLIGIETARGGRYTVMSYPTPPDDFECERIERFGNDAYVYWPNGNKSEVTDVVEWIFAPDDPRAEEIK